MSCRLRYNYYNVGTINNELVAIVSYMLRNVILKPTMPQLLFLKQDFGRKAKELLSSLAK